MVVFARSFLLSLTGKEDYYPKHVGKKASRGQGSKVSSEKNLGTPESFLPDS
jgi:hypothetical protein